MSDGLTIFLWLILLLSVAAANAAFARRRAVRFFTGAGLRIVGLKTNWLGARRSPFGEREGRLVFCAHLEDAKGSAIPAWVASAGFIPFHAGESIEVKFSPTGGFPRHPAL